MRTIYFALTICVLFISDRSLATTELEERAKIMATARQNFEVENFQRLEDDSTTYRQGKSRTASGVWKLTVFYSGISEALTVRGNPNKIDANFDDLEMKVQKWMRRFPDSPTARIAYGILLSNRGWAFRGKGYASEVNPESWAPFRKYVAAARTHMEKNKSIAAIDPRWYELMLSIARSEGWERTAFEELLEEGLSREPLYYQTYFLALEYLLPKWHGGLADIENFAQAAVARTRQQEGSGMYARIYWFASQTHFRNDLFSNSLAVWPRMREGFEDVISRYPDSWNLNNYAKFACLAKDRAKTEEIMKRVEAQVVPEAWSPPTLRESCRAWAAQR